MAVSGPNGGQNGGDEEDAPIFSDINITPLTDIFLVLLIIFMVTSTALVEAGVGAGAGVQVDLPRGAAKEIRATAHDLAVAILVDGRAVVDGDVTPDEELKALFARTAKEAPRTQVILQADRGVPHGRVVEIMEMAKGAGLSRLAIATEEAR
jgi:biopolymer transport protein ExbD